MTPCLRRSRFNEVLTNLNRSRLFAALLVLGHVQCVSAQDDFFGDLAVSVESNNETNKSWTLTGWTRQKASYGLQAPDPVFSRHQRDWSKVETSAYVRWDWQTSENTAIRVAGKGSVDAIYQMRGEENFDPEEVDEFEQRFQWLDVYAESKFDNQLYIKAGQQIVAWGEAENLRITDLVNTQDLITFGQQDLENLRLPVPALRVNYPFANILLDAVVTYKAGRDDIAPARDEFDPFIELRPLGARLAIDRPDKETELFVRLAGSYANGDWGLMVAEANQNSLDARSLGYTGANLTTVRFSQDRFRAIGGSINFTAGSWLTFAELGLHRDKRMQPSANNLVNFPQGWPEKDQVLAAWGLEFNGYHNLIITGELDYIYTRDHDPRLASDARQLGYSVRALWNGLNERLQLLAVWTELPDQGGRVGRFTLDYDWSDSIELGLLWVSYSAAQGAPLYNYRNNDSIQLQFEYSFQH